MQVIIFSPNSLVKKSCLDISTTFDSCHSWHMQKFLLNTILILNIYFWKILFSPLLLLPKLPSDEVQLLLTDISVHFLNVTY